jgi:hypothetical protein
MPDNLAIINGAIEEHHTIRGHIKLVGEGVTDLEALFTLQRARPDWILGSLDVIDEKRKRLQQTISFLEEGLRNHFAFEERAFPPLLGELLMRALILEHREIKKRIDEAKAIVSDTKLEGLSQEQLLSKKSQIQEKVDAILNVVEKHAADEETILKMLKTALEHKG